MFIAELDHPRFAEFDLSTLRTGIMAGSPCPIEVMKRVVSEMHMSEVTIAYGMTETSPVSCQSNTTTPLEKRVASVGQVQPHLQVKVIDPDTGVVADAVQRWAGRYSPQLLDIIDQCMRLDPLERQQSAFALQRMLAAPYSSPDSATSSEE